MLFLSLFVFFFSFLCHVTFSSVIHHCWFDVSMGIQPITKKPVPTHFPKVLFLNSGGRNLNLSLFLRSMLFLGVAVTTVNASVLKRLPSSMCRKDRWSQIWFSGSEPRVVGFSWRSFTVWNLNRNLITWIYLDSGSYSGDMIFVGILLECWEAFSVWHCWLGVRKSVRPVKIEWQGVGVVVCLERGADCLHMVQLMPTHPRPHHLLPHLNPDWFYLSGTGLPRFSWKGGH